MPKASPRRLSQAWTRSWERCRSDVDLGHARPIGQVGAARFAVGAGGSAGGYEGKVGGFVVGVAFEEMERVPGSGLVVVSRSGEPEQGAFDGEVERACVLARRDRPVLIWILHGPQRLQPPLPRRRPAQPRHHQLQKIPRLPRLPLTQRNRRAITEHPEAPQRPDRHRPDRPLNSKRGHRTKMTPKWLSVTSPVSLTKKLDVISPCAPSKRPSPPSTSQMTAPCLSSGSGEGPSQPTPTVRKRNLLPPPKSIVPSSRNVVSSEKATSDSKRAWSPSASSKRASNPSLPTVVASTELGAAVTARSTPGATWAA